MRPVSLGHRGKEVVDIQTRLQALGFALGDEGADGFCGPSTVQAIRQFQQQRLLLSDGVVGENTWLELVEAGYELGERLLYLRLPSMRGEDVRMLQSQLNQLGFDCGPEDGIFGPVTDSALAEFQRNVGLNIDGIVGESTLDQLKRVHKVGHDGRARKIPDRWDGYVGRDSLEGLRVSLDAAHGGPDPGQRGTRGLLEKDVNLALASRLGTLLEAGGARVYLVRDRDAGMGLYERVESSMSFAPEIHLCIHHNGHASPWANGACTYYFSNGAYFSESGKRLAGYVVGALVRELGRADLHAQGRNYACLREPECLSLMVEPGFVTHSLEGRALATDQEIEAEAAAIKKGIEAYLQRR